MRLPTIALFALLAACGPGEQPVAETWTAGRDGLCLAGEGGALRAGLIAYGPGDTNCSLAGPAVRDGESLTITPSGDPGCQVTVSLAGGRAVVGRRSPACAYYCGPGADFSGRALSPSTAPAGAVTDFAGEPLC